MLRNVCRTDQTTSGKYLDRGGELRFVPSIGTNKERQMPTFADSVLIIAVVRGRQQSNHNAAAAKAPRD
jgi:hypothetical protein